jgi:hypothetical protein
MAASVSHFRTVAALALLLPAAPTNVRAANASPQVSPRCSGELTRLRDQALAPEKRGGGLPDWDHAIAVAISVRARAVLLGSNLLTPDDAARVASRAREATEIVLADEAQSPRIAAAAGRTLGGARGWGTAKPLHIGPIEAIRVVDAYSTGMVLSSLSDWLEVASARDPAVGRALLASLVPVFDHWLAARAFVPPGGGLSFDKIAVADPGVRRYRVFNTDALFARAFLLAGAVAEREGDHARAARYHDAALALAQGLKSLVTDRVLDRSGRVHPDAWLYALETAPPREPRVERGEDSNHASFVLDFLATAVERRLSTARGLPLFSPADLDRLAALLPEAVFVQGPGGGPALSLYVDPADVTDDARGRKRSAVFSFAPSGGQRRPVVSWWRQLSGERRTLDLGQSIRTSWGWSESARRRPDLLATIGQFLDAAVASSGDHGSNLFLARAVWLVSACAP